MGRTIKVTISVVILLVEITVLLIVTVAEP